VEQRSFEAVVRGLNDAGVRYLVAGGVAVVAHGYARFTADLDLVIDLEEENLRRGLTVLAELGYRPRAPVSLDDFADAATRERWVTEKHLTVFSLWSTEHPLMEIDLFVRSPFPDFSASHASALRKELAPGLAVPIVSLKDLLALKRRAGRPQDLEDVRALTTLLGDDDG
jgi:hypothetical protein